MNNLDLVYYINLAHRQDRLAHIKNELAKTNIDSDKIHRIEAIYTESFGGIGCAKSHYLALEQFVNSPDTNKTCLILEDDFIFTHNMDTINSIMNEVFTTLPEFDILMISSNTMLEQPTSYSFVTKILDAQTMSGYIVSRKFAPILLQNYKESIALLEIHGRVSDYCFDMYMKKLQPISNWYCLLPKIGKQNPGYSDIERKHVEYNC